MGASFFVWTLILSNVWVSRRGFNNPAFFQNYLFSISSLKLGDYKRLITSSFLHVDMSHLLFNMLTLFFFGDYIVSFFGGFYFYIIYFGSVLMGGLLSYAYHMNNNDYSAVGASGGVIGILFAAILAFPDLKVGLLIVPIPMPGYVFVLLYIAYTLYGIRQQKDGIGHAAHLGGAIGGVLFSSFVAPDIWGIWWQQISG